MADTPTPEQVAERGLADQLIGYDHAKRDFKNEFDRQILAGVEVGAGEESYCRLYLYGPDSGIDSYCTRVELAMIYAVLQEVFDAHSNGAYHDREAEAIAAWNTRADRQSPPSLDGVGSKVRQALLMARSWINFHTDHCASQSQVATEDGFRVECVCDLRLRLLCIDEAIAALSPASDARERWPLGTRVRKTKGSSWHGRIVGYYSTDLTPVGYAVESEREPGSVQIYPALALERLDHHHPGDAE